MNKNTYLDIPEVSNFIKWFASDEAQNLTHSYYNRDTCQHCTFDSLVDSLSKYYWPFDSFYDCKGARHACEHGNLNESANALNLLQEHLRASVNTNSVEYIASAKGLMSWGGTTNFNNDWFDNKSNLKIVHQTIEILNKQDDDLQKLKSIEGLRFNAGLTKLYSLILKDFVIYDSRVAAALAWFVLKFKEQKKLSKIPLELRFACMPARGDQIRNPLPNAKEGFTGVNNNPSKHAHWNIRANWILSKTIEQMKNSNTFKDSNYFKLENIQPIRALEAALFMWGYDLSSSL